MPRKKSPVTRPGIDPGTVRLVALNHYATPGPISFQKKVKIVAGGGGLEGVWGVIRNWTDF
jgi:hypothetical protein